jgi:hypothetical protein
MTITFNQDAVLTLERYNRRGVRQTEVRHVHKGQTWTVAGESTDLFDPTVHHFLLHSDWYVTLRADQITINL